MAAIRAGFVQQLRTLRVYPDSLFPLFMTPLLALVFLMILDHAGRRDLTAYAVVAPVFIALWWVALSAASVVIQWDRWGGTLELVLATPAGLPLVVFGRILAVTTLGLFGFVEVWLVGKVAYGADFAIHHPSVFAATLLLSAAAMATTALALAALFVLARNAITFVNSASYPMFVLGGVLVPVTFLPDWVEPISRAVFLSWSSDLLRSSLAAGPVADLWLRIAMVAALGVAGLLVGAAMMVVFLRKVRRTGEISYQ